MAFIFLNYVCPFLVKILQLPILVMDSQKHVFFFFRVEVSKLLGKVEMLSVPYVTENTRVNILLPIYTSEKEDAFRFLKQYKQICIDKKEKTMLMLVSLYKYYTGCICLNCISFENLKKQNNVTTPI